MRQIIKFQIAWMRLHWYIFTHQSRSEASE